MGNNGLANGALGLLLSKPAQVLGNRIKACRIEFIFQCVVFRQPLVSLFHNLVQTPRVREGQFDKLDQAGQFGRQRHSRPGNNQSAAVGAEPLGYVAQAAYHYRIFHVAMKIFEYEN